jgi:formiminotetrahydrofolate cyclodeaminase
MYLDGSIRQYLDDSASGKSAPGGGSVSAIAGALGASMASMACNFTVGKKKFADVEDRVKEILALCEEKRGKLLEFMDADVSEYSKVTDAYGMPKETDEEKEARRAAIQEALKAAMAVPLEAFRACNDVIQSLKNLVDIANPNLISDVGVAAILCTAGLEGAKLNVEINLAFLKDEELVAKVREEIDSTAFLAKQVQAEVVEKVRQKVNK